MSPIITFISTSSSIARLPTPTILATPSSTPKLPLSRFSSAPPIRRSRLLSCASSPVSSPTNNAPVHSLKVDRKSIESGTRQGRTLRLRRWATLAEIDAADEPNASDRVQVAAVVQRVRQDFRVTGKVRAPLYRRCDRCAREFKADSRGLFEVWLATDDNGILGDLDGIMEEEDIEAVEAFGKTVLELDLSSHVRDAVYLGLPTKSLCSEDCAGVQGWDETAGSVTYSGGATLRENQGEEEGVDSQQRVLADEMGSRDKLMDLKRKLERQGL